MKKHPEIAMWHNDLKLFDIIPLIGIKHEHRESS